MSNSTSETSSGSSLSRYIRYHLRGRRGLIAAAVIVGIPALWAGWPGLVAAGIAPILIALAPCALMCGLGLCMRHGSSNTSGTESSCCSKQQPESNDDKAV